MCGSMLWLVFFFPCFASRLVIACIPFLTTRFDISPCEADAMVLLDPERDRLRVPPNRILRPPVSHSGAVSR